MALNRVVLLTSRRCLSVSVAAPSANPEFTLDRLTGQHEGIVVFRMNRPKAMNAISKSLLQSFYEAVSAVKFDRASRVVIVKSDVVGAFCAGADLKERATMPLEEVPAFVSRARGLMSELEGLPQPVIAAIDGVALGGGLEMALACDLRVMADSAKVGLTETKLAIIPGAGGTQRLPRLVGVAKAKELIFTARFVEGAEAADIGLANAVANQNADGDAAYQKALQLAAAILPNAKELIFTARFVEGAEAADIGLANAVANQNADGDAAYQKALQLAAAILPNGPIALKAAKLAINQGVEVDLQSGLQTEMLCYQMVVPTKDRVEGLTAFKEKRKPNYRGY